MAQFNPTPQQGAWAAVAGVPQHGAGAAVSVVSLLPNAPGSGWSRCSGTSCPEQEVAAQHPVT